MQAGCWLVATYLTDFSVQNTRVSLTPASHTPADSTVPPCKVYVPHKTVIRSWADPGYISGSQLLYQKKLSWKSCRYHICLYLRITIGFAGNAAIAATSSSTTTTNNPKHCGSLGQIRSCKQRSNATSHKLQYTINSTNE